MEDLYRSIKYLLVHLVSRFKKNGHQFYFKEIKRNAKIYRHYLSIVAIFHNESHYLKEWIDFHLHLGVDHIFLYDNNSKDNPNRVLDEYISRGQVTCIPWPTFNSVDTQNSAYAHAIHWNREECRWMMFIDVDEFVFPDNDQSIPDKLKLLEEFSIIKLPWRVFGTNNHKHRLYDLVTKNYKLRVDLESIDDPYFKSKLSKPKVILDPCRLKKIHVHHPVAWDDKVLEIEKDLLLNHYMFKSEEEFSEKLKKRLFYSKKRNADYQILKDLADVHNITDDAIMRHTMNLEYKKPFNS